MLDELHSDRSVTVRVTRMSTPVPTVKPAFVSAIRSVTVPLEMSLPVKGSTSKTQSTHRDS